MDTRRIGRQQIFAHIPYGYFRKDPHFFLDLGLQPELYLSAPDLKKNNRKEAEATASLLAENGLACTFHAPFLDLNPGAVDQDVRLLSLSKYRAVLEMATIFRPRAIVFHPGYDRWRYDGQMNKWLKESLKTWRDVLDAAARLVPGTKILIENIFEDEPDSFEALFSRIEDPDFGFCFDTGHFFLFSRHDIKRWMDVLGRRLMELHLHDNNGERDEHRAPGSGSFPFEWLFGYLESTDTRDMIFNIEAHTREDLLLSLDYVNRRFQITGSNS